MTSHTYPLFEAANLDKSFFATHAVDNVGFQIEPGEIVALLGENGAGKSTVIKMIAGVYKPDAGTIRLSGADIDDPAVRSKISFVHQTLGLVDWMTVAENIALSLGYPRRFGLISHRAMRRQAEEVLASVGGGIHPDDRIFDLPRTERSLLAIARALVSKPKLLVLDEPTASLPAADVQRLFGVLRTLRDSGVGMLYVSHRLDEVYDIAQRAVIMRNGRVVADRRIHELPHDELVQLIVGHETAVPDFRPPRPEVRLTAAGLQTQSGARASLELRRGEILALCGLRGAGQAEVGRALVGDSRPEAGTLTLDGKPYAPASVAEAVRLGVGFATSNRETEAVAPVLSVRENLFINPAVWGRKAWQFRTERSESKQAKAVLADFQVRPTDPELSLDTFSGGNQQKVILARWFGPGRTVIVLEEPTMGVDIGAKAEIYRLLADSAAAGLSVVVISTDMEEVSRIAHRALVFGRGRVVAEIDGDDLTIGALVGAASELSPITPNGHRSQS